MFPDGQRNRIFGFIDNTIRRMLRPGGGPKPDGTRWDQMIQRQWVEKDQGLKWQTITLPNGMIADMSRSFAARRSDLRTLVAAISIKD